MNGMPEKYDMFKNSCQHFTLLLLDRILRNSRPRVQMLDGTWGSQRMPEMTLADLKQDSTLAQEKLGGRVSVAEVVDDGADEDREGEVLVPEDKEAHTQALLHAFELMQKSMPTPDSDAGTHIDAEA